MNKANLKGSSNSIKAVMKQNVWQEMWLTEVICKITVCQVKNLTVESTPLYLENTFIIFKYSNPSDPNSKKEFRLTQNGSFEILK